MRPAGERPSGWLLLAVAAALAGGLVLAVGSAVELPDWLVVAALVAVVLGVVVFGVDVWREARAEGAGLLRTSGRALGRAVRFLVSLLFP